MTVRLSPLQRQVLQQLAHIRVAPEDAWLTTERLKQVVGNNRVASSIDGLWIRGLIRRDSRVCAWRITDKGREALT